jgi:hypothetical protein
MPSFLDLPPETRTAVYNILLNSALTKNTRILYTGNNPLRCKEVPHSIRHRLSYKIKQDQVVFNGRKIIKTRDIIAAEYHIHHADIDDLLFLAATCRLLRSELLALAWSNADISVDSPTLITDLHCIFSNRLSSDICTFVRTLQVKIEEWAWSAEEIRNIAGFIRRCLPQLEQLILNVPVRPPSSKQRALNFKNVLPTFRAFPSRTTVKFRHHTVPPTSSKYSHVSEQYRNWNNAENAHLEAIRAEVEPVRRGRRDEQTKREQEDQVADVLEATVELRSLSRL